MKSLIRCFCFFSVISLWGQNVLDNFVTPRFSGQGDPLWSPYLGEDPDQTWSFVSGGLRVVGSSSTNALANITGISTANPAVFTTSSTIHFHNGDRIILAGITGTGCSGLNGGSFGTTATVLSSSTFSVATVSGAGCTYSGSGGTAGACQNGQGCGVYFNFVPLNGVGAYSYPASYASQLTISGTYQTNTTNRLRWRTLCSNAITRNVNGSEVLQQGIYVRNSASSNSQQGLHFYHDYSPNMPAGHWVWFTESRVAQHGVGLPDNYMNLPEDASWYIPSASFPNAPTHLFDGLTRFYWDTGIAANGGQNAWSGETCTFADYEFSTVTGEPEAYVSSETGTYNGTNYEVSFAGPKNAGTYTTTYDVAYSTSSSLKSLGFSAGTSGGTVTSNASPYEGVIWTSGAIAEASNMYVGLRPHMAITDISGSPMQVSTEVDQFMATGSHVTISGVGGCTSANGSWTVTQLPQVSLIAAFGGILTQVVVSSNVATMTTSSPHGLTVGRTLAYLGGAFDGSSFVYFRVASVPTSTTLTFATSGIANGTYNDSDLKFYALQAITLNGAGACNSAYTSGGTVVSTDDFTNFSEVVISQVGGAPAPAQSLTLNNLTGGAATYNVPNTAPFTGMTDQWMDLRIHDYAIPSSCNAVASFGVTIIQLCNPTAVGGGLLRVLNIATLANSDAMLVNPPTSQVLTATATNPMVLTLNQSFPAVSSLVGHTVHLWAAAGTGCSGMNAVQAITAVSGNQITIAYNGAGCTYSGGSATVYPEDILVRVSTHQGSNILGLEAWAVDGTGYSLRTDNVVGSWTAMTFPVTGASIGDSFGAPTAKLAYARWCKGLTPLAGLPPQGSSASCPGGTVLADWEFETALTDSSSNALNLTGSGSSLYTATPTYAPGCNAGTPATYRAGQPVTLSGLYSVPLDGSSSLAYLWQQLGSAEPGLLASQSLIWSGQKTSTPTVKGTVVGPLNMQLTVTDSSGQSTTCATHYGVVATDVAGNVVMPSDSIGGWAKIGQLVGPLLSQSTVARWPWLQQISLTWADQIGSNQGKILSGGQVTEYIDAWNTAATGTVTATNGSATVTGSGTSFKDLFCGGGTSPVGNVAFIGWYTYTLAGGGGGTGRRGISVAGCPSQTSLTLASPWTPPTQSGMGFSTWSNAGQGSWTFSGNSINYYDNVLAFYAMYLQTGIDTYLHYGRWLPDRWWTSPAIDRGNSNDCVSDSSRCNNATTFPRMEAYGGLYARAIDQDVLAGSAGSSAMWPGMRLHTDGVFRYGATTSTIGDLRENSNKAYYVALCAAYDPDATHAAACRADVAGALTNIWQPARRSDGSWQAFAGRYSSTSGYSWPDVDNPGTPGTVTVTQGSGAVTLVGGTFDPTWFPAGLFTMHGWNTVANYDSTYYTATYVDSTHISISPNYVDNCSAAGNSCSGRDWVIAGTTAGLGFVTQPYMLGIAGHSFNQAAIALALDPAYSAETTLAKSYVVDAAKWIATSSLTGNGGTDPATRGALYGVGGGICKPGNSANGCRCGSGNDNCADTSASRENMGEALGELGIAYSLDSTLQSAVDNVFSAAWGKYATDPGYDGSYAADLEATFFNQPKWFGFFWGMGRNASYLSTRQGGVASPVTRTIQVPWRCPSSISGCSKVRISIVQPNGAPAATVCTTSPCAVSVDARQGNHLYQLDYLSSGSATLAPGALLSLHTQ